MLIGLGYKARSGKDTVADYLVVTHGFYKVSFATALKEAAKSIFGLNEEQLNGDKKEVLDSYWGETPRSILQKLGTECLRYGYSDDVWVRALLRRVMNSSHTNIVIPDVRFTNEAEAVKRKGGLLICVTRPDSPVISTPAHPSETSMDGYSGWDHFVLNDSTIGSLCQKVEDILDNHKKGSANETVASYHI